MLARSRQHKKNETKLENQPHLEILEKNCHNQQIQRDAKEVHQCRSR